VSRGTRAGLVALAVTIAVVAFLVIRPTEEERNDRGARGPATGQGDDRPAEAEPAAPPSSSSA
jgi:hypothetical protein